MVLKKLIKIQDLFYTIPSSIWSFSVILCLQGIFFYLKGESTKLELYFKIMLSYLTGINTWKATVRCVCVCTCGGRNVDYMYLCWVCDFQHIHTMFYTYRSKDNSEELLFPMNLWQDAGLFLALYWVSSN